MAGHPPPNVVGPGNPPPPPPAFSTGMPHCCCIVPPKHCISKFTAASRRFPATAQPSCCHCYYNSRRLLAVSREESVVECLVSDEERPVLERVPSTRTSTRAACQLLSPRRAAGRWRTWSPGAASPDPSRTRLSRSIRTRLCTRPRSCACSVSRRHSDASL